MNERWRDDPRYPMQPNRHTTGRDDFRDDVKKEREENDATFLENIGKFGRDVKKATKVAVAVVGLGIAFETLFFASSKQQENRGAIYAGAGVLLCMKPLRRRYKKSFAIGATSILFGTGMFYVGYQASEKAPTPKAPTTSTTTALGHTAPTTSNQADVIDIKLNPAAVHFGCRDLPVQPIVHTDPKYNSVANIVKNGENFNNQQMAQAFTDKLSYHYLPDHQLVRVQC